MTPEAALTKLSYVLGKESLTPTFQRKMMCENVRGELTTDLGHKLTLEDNQFIVKVSSVLGLCTGQVTRKSCSDLL